MYPHIDLVLYISQLSMSEIPSTVILEQGLCCDRGVAYSEKDFRGEGH